MPKQILRYRALRVFMQAGYLALLLAMPALGSDRIDLNSVTGPPVAAVADFDGDNTPDIAVEFRTGDSFTGYIYHVDIELSDLGESSLSVMDSDGLGLNIAPVDLDGDHDLDLVITSDPLHRPIGVWINDGTGKFVQVDPDRYSASIWYRSRSLKPFRAGDQSLNTTLRRTLHHGILARTPISGPVYLASPSVHAIAPFRVYRKFPPPLRAPPLSI